MVLGPNGDTEFANRASSPALGWTTCTLSGRVLIVQGQKRDEKEKTKKDYYVRERSFGSFERTFVIPDGISTDKVEEACCCEWVLMQLVVASVWLGMRKFGIADPGVFGEPLMHDMAERTVSPAKKYRSDAEGRGCDISPSRDFRPVFGHRIMIMLMSRPHGSAQTQ